MSIGVHVGRDQKTLTENIKLAVTRDYPKSQCVQIFTHGPRNTKHTSYDVKELKALTESGIRIYNHSSYMTTIDRYDHIYEQLAACDEAGLSGLVIHLPIKSPTYIAGHVANILKKEYKTPLILEMRAVKSQEWSYETPEKIIALVKALEEQKITPQQAFICIDTAHIYAGKAPIRTAKEAGSYLAKLESVSDYIRLLHLNGNQYDCNVRAGDKHTTPLSDNDMIWSKMSLADSGCLQFVKWFAKKDTILEQDQSNKDTQSLYTHLAADTTLIGVETV